jgi:hypothetical protein
MSDFMIIKRRRATYSTNSRRRRYKWSRNAKKTASAIAYFKRKILVNENVSRGPDGYYTWLLKDIGGGRVLVAGHTRSQQELGTLHKNLDDFTGAGTIVAAGEFIKEEDRILFNLQSGSYMLAVFKRIKSHKAQLDKRDELIALATTAFATTAGLRAAFNPGTKEKEEEELAGAPMIDVADIRTRLSEIKELDEILSESS